MKEFVLFEDEALDHTLVNGAQGIGLNLDARLIEEALPVELGAILTRQIIQVIEAPSFTEIVQRIQNQPPPNKPEGYQSRVWARYREGRTESMTFYRIKDSWQSHCLSLAGLAIALSLTATPSAIVPAANLLLTTWNNLVILRRPDDALMLDTYEALIKAQAALLSRGAIVKDPDVEDICREIQSGVSLISCEEVLEALKNLRERGLVEVSYWGHHSGDYADMENRWRPKL